MNLSTQRRYQKNSNPIREALIGKVDRRYYAYNNNFVIIEDSKSFSPLLVVRKEGERTLSVLMFQEMKKLCYRLFCSMYSLKIDFVSGHSVIRVIRLVSEQVINDKIEKDFKEIEVCLLEAL